MQGMRLVMTDAACNAVLRLSLKLTHACSTIIVTMQQAARMAWDCPHQAEMARAALTIPSESAGSCRPVK